jgi:hypothetical protein
MSKKDERKLLRKQYKGNKTVIDNSLIENKIRELIEKVPLDEPIAISEKAKIYSSFLESSNTKYPERELQENISIINELIEHESPITEKQKWDYFLYEHVYDGIDLLKTDSSCYRNKLFTEFLFEKKFVEDMIYDRGEIEDEKLVSKNSKIYSDAIKIWKEMLDHTQNGVGDEIIIKIKRELDSLKGTHSSKKVLLFSYFIYFRVKKFKEEYNSFFSFEFNNEKIGIDLDSYCHILIGHYGEWFVSNPSKTYFYDEFPFDNFFEKLSKIFSMIGLHHNANRIEIANNKSLMFYYKKQCYGLWFTNKKNTDSYYKIGSFYPLSEEEIKTRKIYKEMLLEIVNAELSFFILR